MGQEFPDTARLHPDDLAALARAVAAELRGDDEDVEPIPEGAEYATAPQLARRYQVSEKWVNKHAAKLGATPISDARNSKRRFHLRTADAFMASRREPDHAPPVRRGQARKTQRRATHTPSGIPLPDFV